MKKPIFRIEIITRNYLAGVRYTSRIVRNSNSRIIWSSTSQLYSREIDARREAATFLRAAKAGRVEIVV